MIKYLDLTERFICRPFSRQRMYKISTKAFGYQFVLTVNQQDYIVLQLLAEFGGKLCQIQLL